MVVRQSAQFHPWAVALLILLMGEACASNRLFGQSSLMLHSFERMQLTKEYYSEGANAGDLNHDGIIDVVYGPQWYEGPSFEKVHEIYAPKSQNREGYADHFFAWIYDFNGDGWGDVFTVGFPGTPAFVYENPGLEGMDSHWKKHQVFDWVSNESPQFIQIVGDERPELVCSRDGFFGYATIDWLKPFAPWKFYAISEQIADKRFGHGLGVGDVDGDGSVDVIYSGGWLQQPTTNPGSSRWLRHPVAFTTAYGGAEMYAYDVDGDGDNDIICSNAAHDYGLDWYEQTKQDSGIAFKRHVIMGTHPSENRYGVLFTELHSLNLADIDGDGLKDIVTGKTYYSHHKGSPLWNAGAVVYWFKLVRNNSGVDWIPYLADSNAGIGRQLSIVDLQGDGLLDIVVGGMKGAHVLKHQKREVDRVTFDAAQPKPYEGPGKLSTAGAAAIRGQKSKLDEKSGLADDGHEAEALEATVTGGDAREQKMNGFKSDRWSGGSQLWWGGARPGDTLELKLPESVGLIDLEVVMTCARDYGIVQLALDGKTLGKPIDLYESEVVTTGVLIFKELELKPGPHVMTVQILGANPKAVPAFMVGLDFIRIRPHK